MHSNFLTLHYPFSVLKSDLDWVFLIFKKFAHKIFIPYYTQIVKYAYAVTIGSNPVWSTSRYYVYLHTGSNCNTHRVWSHHPFCCEIRTNHMDTVASIVAPVYRWLYTRCPVVMADLALPHPYQN